LYKFSYQFFDEDGVLQFFRAQIGFRYKK